MKKAINKNVKRATALALSMTMLLGLGLSSYAEGEYNVYDEIDTAIIIDDNDVHEVQLEDIYKEVKVLKIATREDFDGVSELQRVKIADDKIAKEEPTVDLNAPGAIQRTEAAMDAVGALIASETDSETEESNSETDNKPVVIEVHQQALNEIMDLIGENGADKDLKQTETDLNNITSNLKSAEKHEKAGNDYILDAVIESNKEAIDASANKASANVTSAEGNVAAANAATTIDAAVAAKDAASADLSAAKLDLKDAVENFNIAVANKEEVSEKLVKAEEEFKKAADDVKDAKEALAAAEGDSDKALKALNAAKEKMDALQSQVSDLTYDLENLESIEEQYRSMMIWYFRELKCEQFDDEGHLDVNASAQKALEADLVDDKANAPGNTVMEMSRYLMDQLITQMIYSRDNVLYNSISIDTSIDKSIGEKAVDKKAYEAEVYTKKDKNFDIDAVEFSRKTGEFYTEKWANVDGNNGRNNHLKVTYQVYNEETGKYDTVTEYYNYILKNSAYDDDMDIADGPIYLALVKYDDETKEWSNSPVVDDNNYSSYSKLVNAIDLARQATRLYNDYMDAKNAVDKAQKRTQELVDQIAKIKISDLAEKSAKIEELKEALKKANEELDKAKDEQTKIEDKIKEVQKAIDEIDLTRFDVVTNDDTTDDTAADPQNIQNPANPNAGQGQGGAGQQNANIDGQQGQAAQDGNEDLIIDDENSATAASVKVADDEGATRPVFTVTDEASATAASVEEAGANLWWLLLLLLLALMIAFAIYKYAENKRNAEINN